KRHALHAADDTVASRAETASRVDVLVAAWEAMTTPERREIIRTLTAKITVGPTGDPVIAWAEPGALAGRLPPLAAPSAPGRRPAGPVLARGPVLVAMRAAGGSDRGRSIRPRCGVILRRRCDRPSDVGRHGAYGMDLDARATRLDGEEVEQDLVHDGVGAEE